jgi:hemoglobin
MGLSLTVRPYRGADRVSPWNGFALHALQPAAQQYGQEGLPVPEKTASLYTRLGGYDVIAAVVDDLLPRLRDDPLLGRFWTSPRSVDTNNRERQLAVDFIAAAAGGPTIYLGRDMKLAHTGMGIGKADYAAFMRCVSVTLDTFKVPEPERGEVVAFTLSLEPEIAEA